MSMSVLISDKSVPFASVLAGSLRARNASVALLCGIPEDTVPGRKESVDPSALCEIPWNRSSDLSARTVLLEIRNCFGPLDQAVLVFDLPVFAERLTATAGHAAVIDEYIKGYLLLALEIVSLFVRGKKGRLVFVVRGRQPESRPPAGLAPRGCSHSSSGPSLTDAKTRKHRIEHVGRGYLAGNFSQRGECILEILRNGVHREAFLRGPERV